MGTDNRDPAGPVTFAGGLLDRYRHVCAFFDRRPEDDAILDPFIRQGADGGDRLLYLVDPSESAAPVNRLRRMGFDAAGMLADKRCDVRTWTETYLRGGHFDQEDMLALLDDMLLSSPSPRIRLRADMGWAAQQRGVTDSLIEFEARANFIHVHHQHVVICAYDTTRFDGAFIIDILRTHPMVLIGGMLQENPFFVPPAELLEERARRAGR